MTQTSSSRNSLGISRKILRGVAAATLAIYSWSFAFAGTAIAATHKEPDRWHGKKGLTPAQIAKKVADDAAKRKPQMPLFPYHQAAENSKHRHIKMVATKPLTLLDEVGRLAHPVADREAMAWKTSLKEGKATGALAGRLHLWLGEWELAKNEQPEQAIWHFNQAKKLSDKSQQVYGLASYDTATALFYEGAYVAAGRAFSKLENGKTALPGYDVHRAALWLRHAGACAGYHEDHARKGIPEPPRLDPLCGAAGLAAILRSLGRPWGEKTVLAAIHHTGEGSSFQDIIDGAQKLGLSGVSVSADDQGLMGLPKPVVAYVERDHFITVTRADKAGVSYLCSDCGPWPGGRVDLTWAQWHTMNPGLYVSVTKPKSQEQATVAELINPGNDNVNIARENDPLQSAMRFADVAVNPVPLRTAEDQRGKAVEAFPSVRVAFAGSDRDLGQVLRPVTNGKMPAGRPHVIFTGAIGNIQCGNSPISGQCTCACGCPTDGPGTVTSGGPGTGPNPTSPVNGTPIEAIAYGPSHGDPVNLATGEEEYSPEADLTVYNPQGPSVTWERLYDSLRGTGDGYPSTSNATYECADFGIGWSHTYNVCVYDPTNGATGTANLKYVIEPNGARTYFTALSAPTASVPKIQCTVQSGIPMLVEWDYSSSSTTGYYTITYSDRTKYITGTSNTAHCYQLAQITDRNGNSIYFNYASIPHSDWYLLSSISTGSGATGTVLLSIVRAGDGTGNITQVNDCYGRSIYYHCDTYYNKNVGASWPQSYQELDHVSQIVPTCTLNPADRYAYGYQLVSNLENTEQINFLHTITVPSPVGIGASTAIINYDPSTDFVSSIVDGNGNIRSYTSVNQSGTFDIPSIYTKVVVSDHLGNVTYSYTASYDTNMSETSHTDGVGRVVSSRVFSDPNDPFRPSAILDGIASQFHPDVTIGLGGTSLLTASGTSAPVSGTWDIINSSGVIVATNTFPGSPAWNVVYNSAQNQLMITVPTSAASINGYVARYSGGHSVVFDVVNTASGSGITNCTWDQYGNLLSRTSPRGTVSTYTFGYSNFALGELISQQEGTKSPTTYSYYEPSGLEQTITQPLPGTVGGASTATTTYTYDSLGNITSVSESGNNSASTITTNINYTTDGTYSQTAAKYQPIAVTDGLGNVTHYRYDSQGNETASVDSNGNTTTFSYDLTNKCTQNTKPATGQTGPGQSYLLASYLYPGGPIMALSYYDENGVKIRQETSTYGPEGETLSLSGCVEPVVLGYDALYRRVSIQDGNGSVTHYAYNSAGYVSQLIYPNVSGSFDTLNYTNYDANGNILTRIDGRGIETDYIYNDPERKLTDVSYTSSSSSAIHLTYDAYGRMASNANSTATITYGYDDNNLIMQQNTTYSSLPTETISYAYYPDGNRESMNTPAGQFTYYYDQGDRLIGLTNPAAESTSWSYQNNGWLSSQQMSNGVSAQYTYLPTGTTSDIKYSVGTTVLSEFSGMQYDASENRTQESVSISGASSYGGSTSYSYDSRNQLTKEQSTRNGGYTNVFGYDAAGNGTSFKGNTYTFDSDNQITNSGFHFDGDGNPTTYFGTSISYDAEDQMTQVGSSLTSGYRPDGLRGWKQGGSSTTYYLYDGMKPVCELNSSGAVISVNTFGTFGLVSRWTSSGSIFYSFDPSGNVTQRLDASATAIITSTFDAFGAEAASSTPNDPFGFGAQWGYYTDRETGLVLAGHRYYDPSMGRFVTRDPIGVSGGINIYSYVKNNPITSVDPSGHGDCEIDLAGCMLAALAVAAWAALQVIATECGVLASAVAGICWTIDPPMVLPCITRALRMLAPTCCAHAAIAFAASLGGGTTACLIVYATCKYKEHCHENQDNNPPQTPPGDDDGPPYKPISITV